MADLVTSRTEREQLNLELEQLRARRDDVVDKAKAKDGAKVVAAAADGFHVIMAGKDATSINDSIKRAAEKQAKSFPGVSLENRFSTLVEAGKDGSTLKAKGIKLVALQKEMEDLLATSPDEQKELDDAPAAERDTYTVGLAVLTQDIAKKVHERV